MRILFITATRIGDAVISTGVLSHLVEQYPQAKFTIACGPLAASLFDSVPRLERVIVVRKQTFCRHWFALWNEVRGRHWDLVIDLRRSLLSYFVGASARHRLEPDDHTSHRVALLSSSLGLDSPVSPKIWLTEEHHAAARTFLAGRQNVVTICPVAARPEKTWPAGRFADLASSLVSGEVQSTSVLFVGSEQDRSVIEEIAEKLPPERVVSLVGHTDLLFVGAVLSQTQLTIANDSGLAHLAAVVGCPTVALFGPTRDDLYRPWGPIVQVVCGSGRPEKRSISDISVEEVRGAATPFLS